MIGHRCTVVIAFLLSLLVAAGVRADVYGGSGRTVQTDLMLTGAPQFHGAAFNGRGIRPMVSAPSLPTQFANGPNLYEYLGSSPWMRSDPMGLSWDSWDMFDDAFAIGAEHSRSGLVGVNQALYFAKDGIRLARAYERAAFLWDDLVWDRDVGILFSLIGGPFFSTICFEAGTPILLSDGSVQTIEAVSLGAAVFSTADTGAPTSSSSPTDPDAYAVIDPQRWSRIDLLLHDSERGSVKVSLLRPREWVETTGLRRDGEMALNLPGIGVSGRARVTAIGPCPEVNRPAPGGQIVTGTFVTERATIVRVWLEGESSPIGATPDHPFYSEDRLAWTSAGDLRSGERIRTLDGTARLARLETVETPTTVYNFEVHRSHTYYVGESRVWVHNECSLVRSNMVKLRPGLRSWKGEQWPAAQLGERIATAESHGHAYGLLHGINGVGQKTASMMRGWVEFLDDAGTLWRFIADP